MNLFICWNSFSILEFLAITKNYREYYVYIDRNYNRNSYDDIKSVLDKFILNHVILGYVEDIYENEYENVVMASWLNDYNLNIISHIKYKHIKLIEEGLSDYVRNSFSTKEATVYKTAELHVNNVYAIRDVFMYGLVNQIRYEDEILEMFFNIIGYDARNIEPEIDLVVFTSPIGDDFDYPDYLKEVTKYLNDNYSGKNILLKKHPRDCEEYVGKYHITEINKMVPGQFVDLSYTCKKLYTHPSTVLLSSKDMKNTDILKFKNISNEKYRKSFEYDVIKECNIIEI